MSFNIQDKAQAPPFAETLHAIEALLPPKLQNPKIGIVCGSGLSGLVDSFKETVIVPYDKLPGFAKSTVPGHKSALAFGLLGSGEGVPAVAMLGRIFVTGANAIVSK
ncbi:hypothetical protein H0H93_004588 [Arthromyces matolae]|nr:hypothetical protein H0H93_004588 [Arthromyces matolae]